MSDVRIFVSWSGERSRLLGSLLNDLVTNVFGDSVTVWMSDVDIRPGQRWLPEIFKKLHECDFGFVCLTSGNQLSPWLMFEAGALAKNEHTSGVCPILLDVQPDDVDGPLAAFQAVRTNREDLLELVMTLNHKIGGKRGRIEKLFDFFWKDEKERVDELLRMAKPKPEKNDGLNHLRENLADIRRLLEKANERSEERLGKIDRRTRILEAALVYQQAEVKPTISDVESHRVRLLASSEAVYKEAIRLIGLIEPLNANEEIEIVAVSRTATVRGQTYDTRMSDYLRAVANQLSESALSAKYLSLAKYDFEASPDGSKSLKPESQVSINRRLSAFKSAGVQDRASFRHFEGAFPFDMLLVSDSVVIVFRKEDHKEIRWGVRVTDRESALFFREWLQELYISSVAIWPED